MQVVPVEGRAQQGKPGPVGSSTAQGVAVKGVKIRVGEGGGDGSGCPGRDPLPVDREENERMSLRCDADETSCIDLDAFDPGRGKSGRRLC